MKELESGKTAKICSTFESKVWFKITIAENQEQIRKAQNKIYKCTHPHKHTSYKSQ